MARKIMMGKCHICGVCGRLSFEHVPPQGAFNNKRTISVDWKKSIRLSPDEEVKGPVAQGGIGYYTLCSKCNSTTGSWYGNQFIDWCYQGLDILIRAKGNPKLIYIHHLFPLAIIKQIVVMFFSVNPPRLAEQCPDLVKFVLNKHHKYLSPRYRFFVYYNIGNKFRYIGDAHRCDYYKNEIISLSEINYPPFGYVMTIDSKSPDNRLFEITHFAKYGYDEFKVMALYPQVLETHLAFPADYRSKKEIEQCAKDNLRDNKKIHYKKNGEKVWLLSK